MGRTELYPYELLTLLEELEAAPFSGTLTIRADGFKTLLYLRDGSVRYARSDRLMCSFAAYLTTERVLGRLAMKRHLGECGQRGETLERHLLDQGICTREDLRYLKRDLARQVFAAAFADYGQVALHPDLRRAPEYRQPLMDPFEAFFRCVAEQPSQREMRELVSKRAESRLVRGPRFFTLMPEFRRAFGRSALFGLVEHGIRVRELAELVGEETGVKQAFACLLSGIGCLEGEAARHPKLGSSRTTGSGLDEGTPGDLVGGRQGGSDLFTPGLSLAAGELPVTAPEVPTEPFVLGPPDEDLVPSGGGHGEPWQTLSPELQSANLIEAAEQVMGCNHYALFGVGPWVSLSQLRAGYRQAWREYGPERFEGTLLTAEAAVELEHIRARIELAYEVLADRHERWSYNLSLGLEAQVSLHDIDAIFHAEETFEAARAALFAGDWATAGARLESAIQENPREPEYQAYLAWVIWCQGGEGAANATQLTLKALELEPQLESGWIIHGRVMERHGDLGAALEAFTRALSTNPDNQEASAAVERLRAQGVAPAGSRRTPLRERLLRLVGAELATEPPPPMESVDEPG
jgi:hypothetical protein